MWATPGRMQQVRSRWDDWDATAASRSFKHSLPTLHWHEPEDDLHIASCCIKSRPATFPETGPRGSNQHLRRGGYYDVSPQASGRCSYSEMHRWNGAGTRVERTLKSLQKSVLTGAGFFSGPHTGLQRPQAARTRPTEARAAFPSHTQQSPLAPASLQPSPDPPCLRQAIVKAGVAAPGRL